MYRALVVMAVLLASCTGTPPPPQTHEVRCNDLSGVSFRFTQPPGRQAVGAANSPWHSVELVWLGADTGLSGRDLLHLRVIQTLQRVFGPEEVGPSDPAFDSSQGRLVPSVEFVFSEAGAAKFRELLDKLWNEREQDYFSARGIAVLLNGEFFLHLHSSPSLPPGPAWQVELTREKFSELVSYIDSTLGCV